MTGIEEVVRRVLHDQVRRQPAMTEPAERAISGARALRRRHAALGVSVTVVVVVAVVWGGVALRGRGTGPSIPPSTGAPVPATSPSAAGSPSPPVSPSAAASLPMIGLSAIVENQNYLLTPGGTLLSLSKIGASPGVTYQFSGGWLVNASVNGSFTDGHQLWLLRPDGSARLLLDHVGGADGAVFSADGRRLAWLAGGQLHVGHLDGTGAVVTDTTTQAPEQGYPLAYAGSAVLLGYSSTGGGYDNFDVWVPQQGRYTATWDRAQANGIVGIFGATADGRWLIGNVLAAPGSGGKSSCLGRIDPLNNLRVVARACGLPEAREWGSVSPDGHWLGYQTINEANGRTQTTLVDLTTVFQQPNVDGSWPLEYPGSWIGPDTMITQGLDERFYRYRVGQPTGEEVAVTGMPPGGKVILVHKLS